MVYLDIHFNHTSIFIKKELFASMTLSKTSYTSYIEDCLNTLIEKGTDKYGRSITFLCDLFSITQEKKTLSLARELADSAIEKLVVNKIFRGHPDKPYYEAMDGVGNLLSSLLKLDLVIVF